eukprot:m.460765 g.460765  ORF g.460765 m.460765 type:complete len:956 (-) comp22136_c0_seq1:71-2938(-)
MSTVIVPELPMSFLEGGAAGTSVTEPKEEIGSVLILGDARGYRKRERARAIAERLLDQSPSLPPSETAGEGSASDQKLETGTKLDVVASEGKLHWVAGVLARTLERWTGPLDLTDAKLIELRDHWRRTCRAWSSVSEGNPVDYDAISGLSILYSCGTTAANAMLMSSLLETKPTLATDLESALFQRRRCHVTVLCGGSGAEVMAIAQFCDEVVARMPDSEHSSFSLHFDVLDNGLCWQKALDEITTTVASNCMHLKVSTKFHCCDLLDPNIWKGDVMAAVETSDLVTLVYGLSELHGISRDLTSDTLRCCARAMPNGAALLIADPLSLNQHGTKPAWVHDTVSHCAVLLASSKLKVRIPARTYESTVLGPWHRLLQLRYGHDIKVFTNSWIQLYQRGGVRVTTSRATPEKSSCLLQPLSEQKQKCPSCQDTSNHRTVLFVVPESHIQWWRSRLQHQVFIVTGLDGGDLGRTIARVVREVESWRERGGMLLVDFGIACAVHGHLLSQRRKQGESSQSCLVHPTLLIVDEVQRAWANRRRIGKASIRVTEALSGLRATRVVGIMNVSDVDVQDGTILERAENGSTRQHLLPSLVSACRIPHCPLEVSQRSFEDLVVQLSAHDVHIRQIVRICKFTLTQVSLLSNMSSLGWTLIGGLARLAEIHPALLLTEYATPKLWGSCVAPTGGDYRKAALATLADYGIEEHGGTNMPWVTSESGRMTSVLDCVADYLAVGSGHVVIFAHEKATVTCFERCEQAASKILESRVRTPVSWNIHRDKPTVNHQQSSRRKERRVDKTVYVQWQKGRLENVTVEPISDMPICFNFNRAPDGCAFRDACKSAHVCDRQECCSALADHPRTACQFRPCAKPDVRPGVAASTVVSDKVPMVSVIHLASLYAVELSRKSFDSVPCVLIVDGDICSCSVALRTRREAHAIQMLVREDRRESLAIIRVEGEKRQP